MRGAGAPGAGSVVPPRLRRCGARPPLPRRRLALGTRGCLVLDSSSSLRVVVCAVASEVGRPGAVDGEDYIPSSAIALPPCAAATVADAAACRLARGGAALGRRSSAEADRFTARASNSVAGAL